MSARPSRAARVDTRRARRARSEGVWRAAWRRFAQRPRRHGVAGRRRLLPAADRCCRRSAWSRATGRTRSACRTRRRPSSAPARGRETPARSPRPTRPERRHLRRRPARAALQGVGRARRQVQDDRGGRAPTTLPFGGDRLGRDVLAKAIKGTQISVFVGVLAALVATLIGTVLGALARLLRRQGRRLPRVGLQRLHLDPRHPADLRLRGGVRARHRHASC